MDYINSKSAAVLALVLAASCSSGTEKKSNEINETGASEQASEPAVESKDPATSGTTGNDEPANVVELVLDCHPSSSNQNIGRYGLTCQLLDTDKNAVAPAEVSESYKWSLSPVDAENYTSTEVTDSGNYKVNFDIGLASYVTAATIEAAEVKFDFIAKISKKPGTLTSRLKTIYAGLASQKYFRFLIESIRDHEPVEPVQIVTKIEVKIDGDWLELQQNSSGQMTLGDKPLDSNGGIPDAQLFLNIRGVNDPLIRASDFNRFNGEPPAHNAANPLFLGFGDGIPFSITGLRYNGGEALANKNVPAGFPDVFRFQTSADKETWTDVPGSAIDLNALADSDIVEYIWTGSDLQMNPL